MLGGVLLFRYALVVLTAEGLDKEASC